MIACSSVDVSSRPPSYFSPSALFSGFGITIQPEAGMENRNISIIGTGDFARAMASRLIQSEFTVFMGSRNPQGRDLAARNKKLGQAKIVTIPEAIQASNIIFIAVRPSIYHDLQTYANMVEKKILIDVSNPERKPNHGSPSGAEHLASLFPQARVVKAFNTVSAYALESDNAGESRNVYVCSDDILVTQAVHQLSSELGFHAIDKGGLKSCRSLEDSSMTLLPGWGWPTIVMGIVFTFWFVYSILRYYVLRSTPYTWERLPTNVLNKVFGCSSLTLLALAYMPGCFAAFIQLAKGTKNITFSRSLDRWLKMRKQLGLYALLFAVLHMCMGLAMLSPAYYSKMFLSYQTKVPVNRTSETVVPYGSRMNWQTETQLLFGFLAVACMSLLGISSLPSVGNSFNWREWTFVQSHMGFVCLFLSEAHVTVKASPGWATSDFKSIVQGLTFLSSLLPYFTLLMKIILLMPCVYYYLHKIRSGWERGASYKVDVEAGKNEPNDKKNGSANGHSNGTFEQTGL